MLKKMSIKRILERLNYLKEQPIRMERKTERLLKELKASRRVQVLVHFLQEFTWLNLHLREIIKKALILKENFFKELRRRLKLTLDEMSYISHDEIIDFFTKKEKIKRKLLKQRKKRCLIMLDKKGKVRIYTGQKMIKVQLKTLGPSILDQTLKIISGKSVYPGKVRGEVAVVDSIKELGKIKKGNILVTSRTDPDFVPALKKVKAIIADQGGVTTHTAIIARELKIPAVVGTQIAVRILKDGEKIEVNAIKGIIKRLKP